jgi:hypothetical protein
MSGFAFFRFRSNTMLTVEEEQHRAEVIELTKEVLEAKGIDVILEFQKFLRAN